MGEAGAFGGQIIRDTGPFSQRDHLGLQRAKRPQAIRIGADCTGPYACVPAIILGAGRRKPIPETVQLRWMDRKDLKSAIQQAIHDRAVRNLYGNGDRAGLAGPTAKDPVDQLAQPLAGVGKGLLAKDGAGRCKNTGLVGPGPPVDTCEEQR